jgi:hypothetical protein
MTRCARTSGDSSRAARTFRETLPRTSVPPQWDSLIGDWSGIVQGAARFSERIALIAHPSHLQRDA